MSATASLTNQQIRLARPAVLAQSLELRVRELLGDEEIEALRASDPELVLDRLGTREGPWVRWQEVGDPHDHGPGERVYALDPTRGEIRFGDGLHGMIPPIGRDVFQAARYQRGGGDDANAIAPWSPLSLLTPLAGVERAQAPAEAAGGADPQDAAATLRFAPHNLRVRDRALTLRDFELLALQFSPDVAQARALAQGRGVALITVMRGRDPAPSNAIRRELRSYLLARATPSLARSGALRIVAPEPVPVRVRLGVTVTDVSASGAVAREVARRVATLLDPAKGGSDGAGWPLGELPSDAELAASLLDVPGLETLDAVALTVAGAEDDAPLVSLARPTQLAHLVDDGVAVECAVGELEDAS